MRSHITRSGRSFANLLDSLADAGGGDDLVVLLLQEDGEKLTDRLFVVDDQDSFRTHASPSAVGSLTVTVVPRPGALTMSTDPPCS